MNEHILIADDDPALFEALATALELHGYTTQTVSDGLQALRAIQQEPPALLLLDLHMPELDGEALLAKLRRAKIQIPIVLMSGDDEAQTVATKFGVAGYLKKPIAIPRLLAAVAACGAVSPGRKAKHTAA